ncbi:hypothetical protein [Devosia sp. I507]|uniref:non-homologous end-joining DNA ligase LigD n=1 Tax=Devosia sp. I507 TaxID=2083786 RepID=UPI001300A282|nr:hypothetical protein [Devosia sp. I507]
MEKSQSLDDDGEAVAEKLGVRLTSPDRVVYPGQVITKSQLVAYYEDVASAMLPHIKGRPLSPGAVPAGANQTVLFPEARYGRLSRTIALPVRCGKGRRQAGIFLCRGSGRAGGRYYARSTILPSRRC